MSAELLHKVLTLLRLVAFMVFVYLLFGLLVERYSRKPDSQLKAFARTVCSPMTRPVARLVPGADQRRLLLVSMVIVAVFWSVVVLAARAVRPV